MTQTMDRPCVVPGVDGRRDQHGFAGQRQPRAFEPDHHQHGHIAIGFDEGLQVVGSNQCMDLAGLRRSVLGCPAAGRRHRGKYDDRRIGMSLRLSVPPAAIRAFHMDDLDRGRPDPAPDGRCEFVLSERLGQAWPIGCSAFLAGFRIARRQDHRQSWGICLT